MSTTSQKRRNKQQERSEIVFENVSSHILVENVVSSHQDAPISGSSSAKSPRIENSVLEGLRSSLKEAIISEIRSLLQNLKRSF